MKYYRWIDSTCELAVSPV